MDWKTFHLPRPFDAVAAGNDGVKTVVAAWLVACHKAMSISRWVGFMVAGSVREGSSYLP
jgi:hypothetical protein